MIFGVGTDIIEIKRIAKAVNCKRFIEKCYDISERESIKNIQTAAGFFTAKEAIAKALGTGFSGFFPCDIAILKDVCGKPYAVLKRRAIKIALERNISNIHISISHCGEYVTAFAVAEKVCP